MKAVILAADYATRLYPHTLNFPKPLLSIAGKPLLQHIVEQITVLSEVDEIYIVTNNKFFQHFVNWKENFSCNTSIVIVNDQTTSPENRLEAIGDLNFVIENQQVDDDVLVVGGDNLFDGGLDYFLDFFNNKGSTILLKDVLSKELASLYGIVSLNNENKITSFVEKPSNPESTLASTLIYALKKEHLHFVKKSLLTKSVCLFKKFKTLFITSLVILL